MPRASRWCLRSLAFVALTWLAACGSGDSADPTATATPPPSPEASAEATASPTSAATAVVSPGAPVSGATVEAALAEVVNAVRTAEGVLGALDQADEDGVWDPVTVACQTYPALPPGPGSSLPTTSGLWTEAQQPALWPTPVIELDQTSATACFLVAAAHEIPPDARIDAEAPTTAEIVARPLEAALQAIEPRDEASLRSLIEGRS